MIFTPIDKTKKNRIFLTTIGFWPTRKALIFLKASLLLLLFVPNTLMPPCMFPLKLNPL